MEVNQIIAQLGGIRPSANKLGVAVSTVQGWKERGRIPAERIQQIEKILEISLNLQQNSQNDSQNSQTQKITKIDKNSLKTSKNHKKIAKNSSFLIYLALGTSVVSLGLIITADLWRGQLFSQVDKISQIEQKIAIISQNIQKIDEKSQNSSTLSQQVFDKISNLEMLSQTNLLKIDETDRKISTVLAVNNEKVIKIRQITIAVLTGVNYSLLLSNISVNTKQQQQALQILQQNQNGIYTRTRLLDYINDNILQLSSLIYMNKATSPLQKLIAKFKSVIYIRTTAPNKHDAITSLINAIRTDDIDEALQIIAGLENPTSNHLKQLLINRKDTIGALKVLNNWANEANEKANE